MEYVWMVVCPLIGIAIISFLSRKLSARTAFIVTALLFIAMAASGIAKQIIAIATGYDLWYLPLHFSSTFYITVGVSVFAHGKAEHAAQTILFVGGIIMCAMILVRPAAILGNLSGVFTSHIHALDISTICSWCSIRHHARARQLPSQTPRSPLLCGRSGSGVRSQFPARLFSTPIIWAFCTPIFPFWNSSA